jgi:hypothetical protein
MFVGSSTSAVSGVTNLSNALAWIKTNAVNNTAYTIRLNTDVSFASYALDSSAVNSKNGVTIVLKGNIAERKIQRNSYSGTLFTVNTGVTLTLDDKITLVGLTNSASNGLIRVNGGTLVMNDGSIISGNTVSSYGGGVTVDSGSFTMNGGKVSGNNQSGTSYAGSGGVCVWSSGTFTMNGGEISGNTGLSGGVYVGGTFIMSDGKISDNSGGQAGGVYISSSGIFTMNGGQISGNIGQFSGGVFGYSGGIFRKASTGGIIYGNNASPASLKNTKTGSGSGHAVSVSGSYRNSTAGIGVALDSSVAGAAGGWD